MAEVRTTNNVSLRLVLILTLPISAILGASKQEFEVKPINTEVNPGTTVKLSCKVRNLKGECFWLSNSRGGNMGIVVPYRAKYDYDRKPLNGDCSIQIINTALATDDGLWECEAAAGTFDGFNLKSEPIKLTVRNEPLMPIIEHTSKDYKNVRYKTGDEFLTEANDRITLNCISSQGNPPARILWFVDDTDITQHSVQANESDSDRPKTWRAKSTFNFTFDRSQHGKRLRCIAKHDAYSTGSLEVALSLNVSYRPTVELIGMPNQDLEEGTQLTLRCKATANPPATVYWKKTGNPMYAHGENISFDPLKRSDSGTYSCSAKNSVGESGEQNILVDVKFKPKIVHVEPPSEQASLYSSVRLECQAEGNPKPRYEWLQGRAGEPNTFNQRGINSTLYIQNATYAHQGKYICQVFNVIKGKEYKERSREIDLDIFGPPQSMGEQNSQLTVEKDEQAIISVPFCSDPKPTKTFWEWGSVKLDAGDTLARYSSKPLISQEFLEDCYEAQLIIEGVAGSDSRKYYLKVENDRGRSEFNVLLQVKEPVTVSAVVGIVVGCIIVLVSVVIASVYLFRKGMCLKKKKGLHAESENSSQRLSEELHNGGHSPKSRAIPPDALYTDVQHYENLQATSPSPESIVYADLDLPALRSERSSRPQTDRIEYAEIQFKPSAQGAHL